MKIEYLSNNKSGSWFFVPVSWVTTDSSPYEVGREHGALFKNTIHMIVRDKTRKFAHDRDTEKLEGQLEERRDWLRATFPNEYEENEGIAAGAELSPLLTLFACYYFGKNFPAVVPNVYIPKCTSMCVPRGFSGEGTICCSNSDDESKYFFLEYTGKGWYTHVQAIWTGFGGGFGGMNEHGLYIGGTGAAILQDDQRVGPQHSTPQMMVYSLVLRYCKTIEEAVEMLSHDYIMGNSNHLIADASGRACVVEKALAVTLKVYDVTKPLALGNFFLSERDRDPSAVKTLFKSHPSVQSKYESMMHELNNNGNVFTVDGCKEIMSSHYKALPEVKDYASICNLHTSISCVALPESKRLHISAQFPHEGNWREYSFVSR